MEPAPVATVAEKSEYERVGLFTLLAENMKSILKDMGPWSVGALTFGLCILQEKHEQEGAKDAIQGEKIEDRKRLEGLLRDTNLAFAAYSAKHEELWEACASEDVEVLREVLSTEPFCPAHFIGIDHKHKCVLLVVRGTSAVHDVLADITGAFVDHGCGGHSHFGITESAKGLLKKTQPFLIETLNKYPGYSLKLIGHSLGAGAASLLCFMINNRSDLSGEFGGLTAECVGIATPPVLSRDQAISCKDQVVTLVMENDVVARASIANFEQLRKEVQSSGWEEKVKRGVEAKLKEAFDVPESVKKTVSEQLQKLSDTLERDEKIADAVRLGNSAASYLSTLANHADEFLSQSSKYGKEFFERMRSEAAKKKSSKFGKKFFSKQGSDQASGEAAASSSDLSETPQEAGDDTGGEGVASTSDPSETSQEARADATNPLKLYSPGQIVFLARETEEEAGIERFCAVSSIQERLERIVLHKKMISDHLLPSYQQALQSIIATVPS
ncbi:hypothetical protein BSKO_03826 [Bryopsis sp. KO-2023]|nr:hypothetical protein BSKO_03826 [Bryopsis sp. KO-2023]